jgi:hypothetical protein
MSEVPITTIRQFLLVLGLFLATAIAGSGKRGVLNFDCR